MHIHLQKHDKMWVVCLNISVSAAFRAAQENKINIVQESRFLRLLVLFQNLGRPDRKGSGGAAQFLPMLCYFGTTAILVSIS